MTTILDALEKLDPADDSQWTSDGQPRIDKICELTGEASLKRKDITEASPLFTREKAKITKTVDAAFDQPPAPIVDKPLDHVAQLPEPPISDQNPLKALDKQINDLQLQRDVIDKDIDVLTRRRTLVQTREYATNTAADDMRARIAYIRNENKMRVERAALSRAALKGVNLRDLDPRAPIDSAFTKNRRRGTARPRHSVNTKE